MLGTWEFGSKGLKREGWMFGPVFGVGLLLSEPRGSDV